MNGVRRVNEGFRKEGNEKRRVNDIKKGEGRRIRGENKEKGIKEMCLCLKGKI